MRILACALSVVLLHVVGCGDDPEGSGGAGGPTSAGPTSGPGATGSMTTTGAGTTGSAQTSSGQTGATTDATTGTGMDPYAAARAACIAKINELRATKSLPAYADWNDGEACADQQATSDETNNDPHGAFGMCGESGQNECLGAGPGGIESCLESMWAEKDQPGCAGCDACNMAYDPDCPGCDFYGSQTGDVCGHYVNMSALYFTEAACGFSSLGGWDVINFR